MDFISEELVKLALECFFTLILHLDIFFWTFFSSSEYLKMSKCLNFELFLHVMWNRTHIEAKNGLYFVILGEIS